MQRSLLLPLGGSRRCLPFLLLRHNPFINSPFGVRSSPAAFSSVNRLHYDANRRQAEEKEEGQVGTQLTTTAVDPFSLGRRRLLSLLLILSPPLTPSSVGATATATTTSSFSTPTTTIGSNSTAIWNLRGSPSQQPPLHQPWLYHKHNLLSFSTTGVQRSFSLLTATMSTYTIIEKGTPNTKDYKIYYKSSSGIVSPFHDIPLYADTSNKTVFNMVVEIPRWTNHKMEISKEEMLNPIKQDIKKGKVRFVKNLFPHHGYIWNYGALPQTWEDPNHVDSDTNAKGDSDPIDVCDIGSKIHKRGAVIQVKVIGTMCLIDEGETDWKILAIDVSDPLASEINDVDDIEKKMPGYLKATYEWFRYYKVPDGKPENQFAFNGEAKNKAFALKVVNDTHKQWQKLMNKEVDAAGIHCENTAVANSPYTITKEEAQVIVDAAPKLAPEADLPSDVDVWHYITK